ncbi:cell division suppressor protein YneA [Bacillus massiliigorillae]|uniref:cell division suppressor protein YneA n=1 Tax=Bacillus massiliigorillae TaxID=1243664 RepID=UPI00039AF124|nr:LysM peptidoglycan-binding domain-containing protein [Bacillus massiliigorillae]
MRNFVVKNSYSLLFLGLIVMFSIVCLFKYSVDDSENYVEVTVVQGDSLWGIAKKYNYDNINTTQLVSHLEKLNNINGDSLKIGDVILVPVKEGKEKYLTMSNN